MERTLLAVTVFLLGVTLGLFNIADSTGFSGQVLPFAG